jgi:two-component system cell cycle sensor histidine kinase/response regulator CckA
MKDLCILLGFSEEEVLGHTAEDLNFWINKGDKFKLLGELTQKGYIINFEAKFRLKSGKIISGLMSARIVTLNHEKYLISITRDISELKKAEEELIAAKETCRKKGKRISLIV